MNLRKIDITMLTEISYEVTKCIGGGQDVMNFKSLDEMQRAFDSMSDCSGSSGGYKLLDLKYYRGKNIDFMIHHVVTSKRCHFSF